MENKKFVTRFTERAEESIWDIFFYITMQGYPDTAEDFANRLYGFGHHLAKHPFAHPVCKNPSLERRKMRCAVFKKNYIFIYRVEKDTVVIYNVIYGRRNPASFSV